MTAFFAPEVWRRWGVGLLHGSLNLWDEDEVALPGLTVELPRTVQPYVPADLVHAWQRATITPVLVEREALGFVIRGVVRSSLVEVFAPTHLRTRLGLTEKTPIAVDVLAADF